MSAREAPAGPAEEAVPVWSRRLPDAGATRAVGLAIGRALQGLRSGEARGHAIVLLEGELGSGKTTLVKAACEALGIPPAAVISPTYTLVNVYPGAPPVYHVDLYRLEKPEALLELDEGDWVNRDGPTFIEWPAAAVPLLAGRPVLKVRLAHDGTARAIRATAAGTAGAKDTYASVFEALKALPDFA